MRIFRHWIQLVSIAVTIVCSGVAYGVANQECSTVASDVSDRTIQSINIVQNPIFDPPHQGVFASMYEAANQYHIPTRTSVIEQDLLFEEGDVYDSQVVEATERRLRGRRYLNAAKINVSEECLEGEPGSRVHVEVEVKEVWTLEPQFRFSQTGDQSTYNIGVQETNLFGSGQAIGISKYANEFREGYLVTFDDPLTSLFESALSLGYSDNDDGGHQSVALVKPFVALDSPWSAGIQALTSEQDDRLYDVGVEVDRYQAVHRSHSIFFGSALQDDVYAFDNTSVTRIVVGYQYMENGFTATADTLVPSRVPGDYQIEYPWFEVQRIRHDFQQMTNIREMNRVEDINLGLITRWRVGAVNSPTAFLDNRMLASIGLSQYFWPNAQSVVGISGSVKGLVDTGHLSDVTDVNMSFDLQYHWNPKVFDNKTQTYVRFHESRVIEPLGYSYLNIGANLGARGYPSRYQSGDRRQIVTFEQRYFGTREWFSLVYVGGAVFYDAAHTWGDSAVEQTEQGWLHSFGAGLRISSNRLGGSKGGGHSTLHLDLAAPVGTSRPVDSLQFLLTVKKSF